MANTAKRYSKEYKESAVKAVHAGMKVAEAALEYNVSVGSIHNWLEEFASGTLGEKCPIQRRKQFTHEEKEKAVQLVEQGMSVIQAAEASECTPRSIYDWLKKLRPELYRQARMADKLEAEAAEERMRKAEAKLNEAREQAVKEQEERVRAEEKEAERVREMLADPIIWMQKYTKTKDSHWRENGADSPYRHLPDWPIFRLIYEDFCREDPYFVEKSRDMLVSWTMVGIFTHRVLTTPGIEVIFQSQKQEKANELIGYARILYEQSDEGIRKACPLDKTVQAANELIFANKSRIIAIPGGGDQIRSYHPWGLLMDEAAFMPEAGECFDHAVSVCKKVAVVSSAGPGWFADTVNDCGEKLKPYR